MEIHITKKDVLWGYIAQFFNIGAGILLLPVILKLLPADILGVWYIFLTISSLVQMIDFGFQPTFTRNVAYVFSEVYYPEGWQAYIDDQPGELFRTDYILRGLSVPAGEHTITLVYNPRSAYQGALISQISSILLILALLGSIIGYIRKNRKCSSDQA